jgi:hypothetical protein
MKPPVAQIEFWRNQLGGTPALSGPGQTQLVFQSSTAGVFFSIPAALTQTEVPGAQLYVFATVLALFKFVGGIP